MLSTSPKSDWCFFFPFSAWYARKQFAKNATSAISLQWSTPAILASDKFKCDFFSFDCYEVNVIPRQLHLIPFHHFLQKQIGKTEVSEPRQKRHCLDNCCYNFNFKILPSLPQARNIETSELAAIKMIKLDPGMWTLTLIHYTNNSLVTACLFAKQLLHANCFRWWDDARSACLLSAVGSK